MKITLKLPDERHNYSSRSPLSQFFTMGGSLVLLLVVLIGISETFASFFVHYIPQTVEHRIFEEWIKAPRPSEPHVMSRELQGLLDRLVKHTPEVKTPLLSWVISQAQPNAAALPGGVILVTDTLLRSASSENEIMMVLAHELGHFKLRHHLRGFSRHMIIGALQLALGADEGAASFISTAVPTFATLSLSRDDESAADEYALEVLHRVYGHVGGATDFFTQAATFDLDFPGARYTVTHPPAAERAEGLRRIIAERGYAMLPTAPKPEAFSIHAAH